MSKYKVLLTTSGVGSRLGDLTKYTNKALVRIGKKPAISYIVEAYPHDVTFVVSLGYYGNQVKDFLELAYPERSFEFVQVDNYDGLGSSLGYSMLQAKNSLQCPFIYHACDTITSDIILAPEKNWIAGFKGDDSSQYASWKVLSEESVLFSEKGAMDFDYLHIGIVGVFEYLKFWKYLEDLYKQDPNNSTLNDGQVIAKMIDAGSGFEIKNFSSWLDIGNTQMLNHARKTVKDHFDNLDKIEESVFLFDKFVIKFFFDKEIIKRRVQKAKILNGLVPEIEGVRDNFYRYKFISGDLYSRVVDSKDFLLFLGWAKNKLWIKSEVIKKEEFQRVCFDFYKTKTLKRVNKFLEENSIKDCENIINGENVPSVETILSKIDFDWLSDAGQYKMHGDFILDNILRTESGYCLLDWRQDFGGLTDVGDIYYDLAKLNHNLVVNHDVINANQFTVNNHEDFVSCDILRRDALVNCQIELHKFITENGFDLKKVKVLTGLIWLNMSPLHHYPFNLFLYYFGKLNLWRAINEK